MPRYSLIEHLGDTPVDPPVDTPTYTPTDTPTYTPTYTPTDTPTNTPQGSLLNQLAVTYPAISFLISSLTSKGGLSAAATAAASTAAGRTSDQNSAILAAVTAAIAHDTGYDSVTINNIVDVTLTQFDSQTIASLRTNQQLIASAIQNSATPNTNNISPLLISVIITASGLTMALLLTPGGPPQESSQYSDALVSAIMNALYCIEPKLAVSAQSAGVVVPILPSFIVNHIASYNSVASNPRNICTAPPPQPPQPPQPGSVPCSTAYVTPSASDNTNNTIFLTGPNCAVGGTTVSIIPGGTILAEIGAGKKYNNAKWIFGGVETNASANASQAFSVTLPNVSSTVPVRFSVSAANGAFMYSEINITITPNPSIPPPPPPPTPPSAPNDSATILKNGVKVFADYTVRGVFGNYYSTFSAYTGGASKFKSDLITEIATGVKISESRLSVTNLSQINGNDLSITFVINNIVPSTNIQKNDYLSAKCVFGEFIALITNTTAGKCNSILPQRFTNVHFKNNVERFIEHALLGGLSSATGTATVPDKVVTVPEDPNKLLDYIFMYSYLFAMLGSIFYGITNVVNINPMSTIANQNVVVAINAYIGLCGFIALFHWYLTPIPFLSTMFNNNVVKSQIKQ